MYSLQLRFTATKTIVCNGAVVSSSFNVDDNKQGRNNKEMISIKEISFNIIIMEMENYFICRKAKFE